jgi:hypothetical protein
MIRGLKMYLVAKRSVGNAAQTINRRTIVRQSQPKGQEKPEMLRYIDSGRASSTKPSMSESCDADGTSKGLEHNQRHNANHQQGRHLIEHPVEPVGTHIGIHPKYPDQHRHIAMRGTQKHHQQQLCMKPAT